MFEKLGVRGEKLFLRGFKKKKKKEDIRRYFFTFEARVHPSVERAF